jgi:hypothetical protein
MPCKPAKARKLLKRNLAIKKWNKLGIFYIQLEFDPISPIASSEDQPLVVGIDPGSKFEGFSVVGNYDTILNIEAEAPNWVKKVVEQRKYARKSRRFRNTRYRSRRVGNRLRGKVRLPPSIKARWDSKLRIIKHLKSILPLTEAVIEDTRAITKKDEKKWNDNFSPIEVGKKYLYAGIKKLGIKLTLKKGMETKKHRENIGLKKLKSKSKQAFEVHCVDAWCLASLSTGAKRPTTKSLYYIIPLQWHRRQLHRFNPEKGGIRKKYGGTISMGLKRGTLVKDPKYGLCYIGGTSKRGLSLHELTTGRRLTQRAKKEELHILTRISYRFQFIPNLQSPNHHHVRGSV